ncbi:MAG: elongation factor 4, partial [Deltaproteobacteria bacterium]|nr:elongation factor 4 [Deltaproteobacteria bacterium]
MQEKSTSHIRNFSIIAHIDHGKSTLADRFLQLTGSINPREFRDQFLDRMDIERERGITIKAQTVRLSYQASNGETYQLNLIDTPGHVDFAYEVSRSLAACEGAILVVDASQGIEAQTLANVYLALDANLEIIPVINKIDLPGADPDRVAKEIEEVIGMEEESCLRVSAKLGTGVKELLEEIVRRVPPPKGDLSAPLQALVYDSWYDSYLGVITQIRLFQGRIAPGTKVLLHSTGRELEVQKVGVFAPNPLELLELKAGEAGFVATGLKDVHEMKIGDTLTEAIRKSPPLPGFKEVKPMVFCGFFPIDSDQYGDLKDAVEKLHLNDASFYFEPETSAALGFGFRCGFLGLLHMEIAHERLEREYQLELIATAPTVIYRVKSTRGEILQIDNPALFPDRALIAEVEEPYIGAHIHVPQEYLGGVISLCQDRRGEQKKIEYITPQRILLEYEMPLAEMVFDFYDKLK